MIWPSGAGRRLPKWLLRDERVTSVIIGASSVEQIADNLHALQNPDFTDEELAEIAKYI